MWFPSYLQIMLAAEDFSLLILHLISFSFSSSFLVWVFPSSFFIIIIFSLFIFHLWFFGGFAELASIVAKASYYNWSCDRNSMFWLNVFVLKHIWWFRRVLSIFLGLLTWLLLLKICILNLFCYLLRLESHATFCLFILQVSRLMEMQTPVYLKMINCHPKFQEDSASVSSAGGWEM